LPISREDFGRLPDPEQTKKEIAACVLRMRNPESFLEGCRQYVNSEKRDGVYLVALEYAKRHENSPQGALFAAQTLLLAWGTRFYSSRMRQVQMVRDDLARLYEENRDAFERLSGTTISRITEPDLSTASELFRSFSACDSIKWTGASKALHVRSPETFVMWDQDIRVGYHLLHSPHDVVACYGEFMKTSNDVARDLVAGMGEDQLALQHPNFESTHFKRTLAKMIDEYNFAVVKQVVVRAKRQKGKRST
jgi:hypothetical protein